MLFVQALDEVRQAGWRRGRETGKREEVKAAMCEERERERERSDALDVDTLRNLSESQTSQPAQHTHTFSLSLSLFLSAARVAAPLKSRASLHRNPLYFSPSDQPSAISLTTDLAGTTAAVAAG